MGSGASRHDQSIDNDVNGEHQQFPKRHDTQNETVTLKVTTNPKIQLSPRQGESIDLLRPKIESSNEFHDNVESEERYQNFDDEEEDPERAERVEMFSHTAMSLDMNNEEFLFNLLYFTGGDMGQLNFGNVMNNALEETVALHSENNLNYKLHPASESALADLKSYIFFRDQHNGTQGNEEIECSVCRDLMDDGCEAVKLPSCGHLFHSDCIIKWLKLQGWCPFCRAQIQAVPLQAPSTSVFTSSPRSSPRAMRIAVQSLPSEGNDESCIKRDEMKEMEDEELERGIAREKDTTKKVYLEMKDAEGRDYFQGEKKGKCIESDCQSHPHHPHPHTEQTHPFILTTTLSSSSSPKSHGVSSHVLSFDLSSSSPSLASSHISPRPNLHSNHPTDQQETVKLISSLFQPSLSSPSPSSSTFSHSQLISQLATQITANVLSSSVHSSGKLS